MSKHFEFVPGDEKVIAPGRTIKRIRALVAIASLGITPGALGGYVEKPENLSGNAWVYGNAWVSGDARVYGNALVYGDARVYGNALVYGDARVYGDAHVSGDARVFGNARVYGDAHVSGDARVFGNAHVSGNARVFGDARVSGNAWVFGNARVFGDARVSGNAWVFGNARVYGDADYLLIGPAKSSGRFTTAHKDEKLGVRVNCGCFTGTVLEFSQQIERTKAGNKEHLEQYRLFCQLIAFNFGIEGK